MPRLFHGSGYSVNPVDGEPGGYAVEMHLNRLKQLGVQHTRRSVTVPGRCVAS